MTPTSTTLAKISVLILFVTFPVALKAIDRTREGSDAFHVESMVASNDRDGVKLDVTFTYPAGDGTFPAAILLSVAGPNDRDQSFAGHAGFQVLAEHLARSGIATARFDDRGVGGSTGDYFSAGYEGLKRDALVILDELRKHPRVTPDRIGFVGMSEGGAIAALSAQQSEEVAFVVLLSAPGLSGEHALKEQLEHNIRLSGVSGEAAAQYRQLFNQFMDIVKGEPNAPETREQLRVFLEGPGQALIPAYQFVPKDTASRIDFFLSPWYRSNVSFDPIAAYGSLSIPLLAVGGALHPIAPPALHLANIEKLATAGSAPGFSVVKLEGLNHIFQDAKTGLPDEYAALDNSISEKALMLVSEWIVARFRE